jgi:tripartite-type tricarboxylate transporter receptor subunit TctC
MSTVQKFAGAALTLLSLLGAPLAGAQTAASNYPNKPIHIILAFPPGGSSDLIVRLIGPELSRRLNGQTIIIDNKPGAGGNIAMDAVVKSVPDGYTLGVGATGALGVNSVTGQTMPYNAQKDLTAIGVISSSPFVLVASTSFKPSNISEVVAMSKANSGPISIGHGGNGTVMQLSTELFKQMANVNAVSVPYKGTGPATVDVMGDQIPLAMSDVPTALQYIKAGRLKALGVTTAKRSALMPDVPTFAEEGLTGYDSTGWFGLVGPAGVPRPIVDRLNVELNAVLNDPVTRARILSYGADPAPGTPEQLTALMTTDVAKWAALVKSAGIKFD